MNDDLMFEYLIQMGQMRPEEIELKRRQAQVDALRKAGMTGPEGQMIGKHYVPPSVTQTLAQAMQGYAAMKQQRGVDDQLRGMNERQAKMLRRLMQPTMPAVTPGAYDPYGNLPTYGNEA